jgi:hypothetical protein
MNNIKEYGKFNDIEFTILNCLFENVNDNIVIIIAKIPNNS